MKTAFRCQTCGEEVIAQNELAHKLLVGGHPALCPECRTGKPAKQWGSYEEYLLSPEWRAKSDERKRLDGYQCRICEETSQLECHHRTYERIYNERIEDLTTLCNTHHRLVTAYENGLVKIPEKVTREKRPVVVVEPEQSNGRKRVYLEPIKAGW